MIKKAIDAVAGAAIVAGLMSGFFILMFLNWSPLITICR